MSQVYVKQNWDKQECVLIELALRPVPRPPLHVFFPASERFQIIYLLEIMDPQVYFKFQSKLV